MTRILTVGLMVAGFALLAPGQTLPERQAAQRARIQQGVQNGSLTNTEAARVRANQRQLHRKVVRNRIDGGGLTATERARLQANANRDSRRIARLKHNGRTQ